MDHQELITAYEAEVKRHPFGYTYEHIYGALNECILHCSISPDTVLKDFQLSNLFNASRTSVRQALFMLAENGLLEYEKGRGFHVIPFGEEEMNHLYDYRRIIESSIAHLAAKHATPQQILELKKCLKESSLEQYSNIYEKGRAYFRYESFFHKKLADMCQNPYLQDSYTRIEKDIKRAWARCFYIEYHDDEASEQLSSLSFYKLHYPIYYAFSIGNSTMARDTMYAHMYYPSKKQ